MTAAAKRSRARSTTFTLAAMYRTMLLREQGKFPLPGAANIAADYASCMIEGAARKRPRGKAVAA